MASDPIQGSELTGEITELREGVLTYEPGNVSTCADNVEFPKQLYIGLFGRTGCGKTSLINSLKFAAHGKLRRSKWQQAAGQEKAGGHTMFRKLADITKTIFAIDNRGLDDPNTENAIAELAAQLDGKRGYSESVEWQEAGDGNDTDDLEDEGLDLSGIDLNKGHPIGCAVFVFSALHDIETNTTGLDEVINFLHSHQGRYPVAIITHVDVAEKNRVEDLRTVLRVYGVSDIFEVANLTPENFVLKEPYQHSLLSLLERCMTDGDETLIFKHYQRKEQQRQKEIEKRREEKRRYMTEELQEKVLTYKPGNVSRCASRMEFPEQLYIGLFGRTGCGKTSLIDSLKFAADGSLRRSQWLQAATQERAGGHTMFRQFAKITRKIVVIDNRGLDDPNTEEAIAEIAAQLDGKRGYCDNVEWQGASDRNDTDNLEYGDLDLTGLYLNEGHPIACALLVFRAGRDIDTNTKGLFEVIDFLHSHQGRYPVAIITHVDVAEKKHVEDLKTVLRVSGVSDIFEVANLTTEKKLLEKPYQHSLLSLLERCMTIGDETLIFKHYQRKEQQRKKDIEKRREEKRRK